MGSTVGFRAIHDQRLAFTSLGNIYYEYLSNCILNCVNVSKLFTRLTVKSEQTHDSKYIIYMSGRETADSYSYRNLHIVTVNILLHSVNQLQNSLDVLQLALND